MPAIAVLAFALSWWAACYLVGRDPRRPAALRAAGGLIAYALGVALWSVAPEHSATQVLLCVPALFWAGAAISLLPSAVPERRYLDRGWVVLSGAFLVMLVLLPPAGRLVVVAPLAGGLVLLWRFRDQVRPPVLTAALAVAAALYAAALAGLLLPLDLSLSGLLVAAAGLDLVMLGFLIAVAEALDVGERLRPDLIRAVTAALVATVLVGGPIAVTVLEVDDEPVLVGLQFALLAVVMTATGLAGPVRRGLDLLAFRGDERLRQERSVLWSLSEALPRHRLRRRLLVTGRDDFLRFARQALDNYGDLGRLMRSPLTDLPSVHRRGTSHAARAVELRALLARKVGELRPAGPFETTDEWRHWTALRFRVELGLDPYARKPSSDGLDPDDRRALEWLRRQVPPGTLRRWQEEATVLVAARLWDELAVSRARGVAPTRNT
ncbi:hypothetical protein [Actinoplanes solisilvae]|uniref:hypothetical protein n=1 Tax=Actinoplanes solisilvae TaxID=2486853 RepID=UPI000FD6BE04|nr:hypothetical protein [Actinoplanes solisilvae]